MVAVGPSSCPPNGPHHARPLVATSLLVQEPSCRNFTAGPTNVAAYVHTTVWRKPRLLPDFHCIFDLSPFSDLAPLTFILSFLIPRFPSEKAYPSFWSACSAQTLATQTPCLGILDSITTTEISNGDGKLSVIAFLVQSDLWILESASHEARIAMTSDAAKQCVPLTCHGHSRPVPHMSFSGLEKDDVYYMISACKGNGATSVVAGHD
jgi:hypothetical protein